MKRLSFLHLIPLCILVLILIFGFLLRAQEALLNNYLFLIDQGRDMMDVKAIVFDGKPTLIGPYTGLQGVFQGPLWYYLLAVPTFLLKGDPVGAVWLMLVLSMLVIVTSYYFLRKQFGITTGLIAAFLFAFSPQAIAAATYAWNPHPLWIIVLLYVIFFYKATQGSLKFYLLALPVISLMFHVETALAVFILESAALYLIIFKRSHIKSKYFLVGLLISSLMFLPQVLFDFRHDFLMSRSIMKIFSGSNQGLFVTGEEKGYLDQVRTHTSAVIINFKSAFPFEGILRPLPFIMFCIFISGIPRVFTRAKKLTSVKQFALLKFLYVILFFILFTMVFIFPFPLRQWYLTGVEVFYILISALILGYYWKRNAIKLLSILAAVIIVYFAVLKIQTLYINVTDFGGVSKNRGKIEAIDYIYKDAKSKDFGLLVFTPPVNTFAYDYLIFWYGKSKYNYIPPAEKKETFYLLIEPDSGRPWSYKGWLETVIIDGRVEKTVKLPSGFVIQKRTLHDKDL